ncbi:MAG: acyl-CoA thioesterase [Crocinitomicaceae bacterium]
MENRTFTYNITIREHHLDTFGHVNNATYLELYEEARWEFITQNGYGLDKVKSTGLGPVILEINVRFMKELRLRDTITIHSQTSNYTSKIGLIKQWMTNSKGDICSDIELKYGLFDTKSRKLVIPTEEWVNAIT